MNAPRRSVACLSWLSLTIVFCLAGCTTPPPAVKAPPVNLAGFTQEFRAGHADGCASVNASRRRDEARYKSDAHYAQGWRDGYDTCRRRQ